MTPRREANRELSRPAFVATLQELFPELETLPHADTLHRLLSPLDVTQLEQAHVAVIRRLIRGKKFHRSLITQCYPIAIDGTQKSSSAAVSVGQCALQHGPQRVPWARHRADAGAFCSQPFGSRNKARDRQTQRLAAVGRTPRSSKSSRGMFGLSPMRPLS